MKCLLVSDLHYTLKQLDWLHHIANRYDVIVVAGDHLDISSTVAIEAQIVVILKYLERVSSRAKLIVSSGNHDLNAMGTEGEKVAGWMARVRGLGVTTDGDCLEVGGATFTVCPWWDGPRTRESVAAQLARDAEVRDERRQPWIWVYHAPPDQSPTSWSGSRHYGDTDLSEWIARYRPDMVLTGHIHQSPFRKGGSWVDRIDGAWVFNAGRQIGPVPCHVVIDTDERNATWLSLAGTEDVRLDDPLVRMIEPLA